VGTIFDVSRLRGVRSGHGAAERDTEEARTSDYILFFGVSSLSLALIALGILKLIGRL